jgi:vacuolar-type H+-ATPase subunit F/Vma7
MNTSTAPVYVGDEVSATGFRLAGLDVRVPESGEETRTLASARTDAPLVLVSAAVASRLAPSALSAALAALSPLMLIVPDLDGTTELPDLAARLRRQLGLDA